MKEHCNKIYENYIKLKFKIFNILIFEKRLKINSNYYYNYVIIIYVNFIKFK